MLVLRDYATCYPEAVPLRNIDPETVAEELMTLFARVERDPHGSGTYKIFHNRKGVSGYQVGFPGIPPIPHGSDIADHRSLEWLNCTKDSNS